MIRRKIVFTTKMGGRHVLKENVGRIPFLESVLEGTVCV
jgi:hypothetical protein